MKRIYALVYGGAFLFGTAFGIEYESLAPILWCLGVTGVIHGVVLAIERVA